MADLRTATLSVPDVSCEHCVKTIDGALGSVQGVQTVPPYPTNNSNIN